MGPSEGYHLQKQRIMLPILELRVSNIVQYVLGIISVEKSHYIYAIDVDIDSLISHLDQINKLIHVDLIHAATNSDIFSLERVFLSRKLTNALDQNLSCRFRECEINIELLASES